MTFWKGGAKKRRDAAEGPIVDALRACGARTWQISGRGLPDLLVLWQGKYTPLEVKTGKGQKTEQQRDVPWPVVHTFDEAATWVGLRAARTGERQP